MISMINLDSDDLKFKRKEWTDKDKKKRKKSKKKVKKKKKNLKNEEDFPLDSLCKCQRVKISRLY